MIVNRHRRTQPVECQAFDKIGGEDQRAINQETVVGAGIAQDEEIADHLALRGQQGGIGGPCLVRFGHGLGQQAVQKCLGIRAGHGENGAIAQKC